MPKQSVVERVWRLTRPVDPRMAELYRQHLEKLWKTGRSEWFLRSFSVKKPHGGTRLIVPAGESLRFVQGVLAEWIVRSLPRSADYCYTGRSVIAAVRKHQNHGFAVTFDLHNAFESVTKSMVTNWLRFYLPEVDQNVIDFLAELLTFAEHLPQGCVSSPYVFNLVLRGLDLDFAVLCKKGGLTYTRYADNVCISGPVPFDFKSWEDQVGRLVRGSGFGLSAWETFFGEPIVFLGTSIDGETISLAEEKYGLLLNRLWDAVESSLPELQRQVVLGITNWVFQVCWPRIPNDLLDFLERYFLKVGRPPQKLSKVLAERQMSRML